MPNIKSANKRVLVAKKKTLHNQIVKNTLRTYLRKFEAAVASGDKELAEASYKDAVKRVDGAVTKGVLHRNTAARKKSGMTIKLNRMA